MTTKPLYYERQDLLEFEARILEIREDQKPGQEGRTALLLDQTAFYPGGGGQPRDAGTLAGIPVADIIEEDRRLWHVLDRRAGDAGELVPGAAVRGVIDEARRRDFEQQHTGQHILSAVFDALGNWPTVSVHLGEDYTAVEFAVPEISREDILRCEDQANRIVREARRVKVHWTDSSGLASFRLRRPAKVAGEIRIVEIEGVDQAACGGLHTADTALAGPILWIGSEKIRGNIRLLWKIGRRALGDYRAKADLLQELSVLFSQPPETLAARAEELRRDLQESRREAKLLKEKMAELMAAELLGSAATGRAGGSQGAAEAAGTVGTAGAVGAAGTAGAAVIAGTVPENTDPEIFQALGRRLAEVPNLRFCLVNLRDGGLSWIVGDNTPVPLDFAAVRENLLPLIGGKGGGKGRFWQGGGTNPLGAGAFAAGWEKMARTGG